MQRTQQGYILPLILLLNFLILSTALSIHEQSLRYVHLCKNLENAVSDQEQARQLLSSILTDDLIQHCPIASMDPSELRAKPLHWWRSHGCRLPDTSTRVEQWMVVEQMPMFRSGYPMRQYNNAEVARSGGGAGAGGSGGGCAGAGGYASDDVCFSYFRASVLQISIDMNVGRTKHIYQRVQKIPIKL